MVTDPGIVVDPGSVHSQIEGGVIFGLSNLLHGGIDIVGGGTAQANLDTTHFLRFNEVPEIDIALISTDNRPGALGEIGTIGVAGAVANALSRATGVGQYRYPFEAVDLIPSPRTTDRATVVSQKREGRHVYEPLGLENFAVAAGIGIAAGIVGTLGIKAVFLYKKHQEKQHAATRPPRRLPTPSPPGRHLRRHARTGRSTGSALPSWARR